MSKSKVHLDPTVPSPSYYWNRMRVNHISPLKDTEKDNASVIALAFGLYYDRLVADTSLKLSSGNHEAKTGQYDDYTIQQTSSLL